MLLKTLKEDSLKSLEQAVIYSLDKSKGKISLYMKNGLITTGYYPYDINDLTVGATVLCGKVDNTFVILNKMANSPRTNKSYALVGDEIISIDDLSKKVTRPTPVTPVPTGTPYDLLFNCNYENGFADTVNGLTPSEHGDVSIEIGTRMFGNYCLKLVGDSYVNYHTTDDVKTALKVNGFTYSAFAIRSEDSLTPKGDTIYAYILQHGSYIFRKVSGGYLLNLFTQGKQQLDEWVSIPDSQIDYYIDYLFVPQSTEGVTVWIDGVQIISGDVLLGHLTSPLTPVYIDGKYKIYFS